MTDPHSAQRGFRVGWGRAGAALVQARRIYGLALCLSALSGCTVVAGGTGTSALATVTPAQLCPDSGSTRADADDLTACISTKLSQFWTAELDRPVDQRIAVAPDPSTVPDECRYFLPFGTAFFCPVNAEVYITGAALDRDAGAFASELPYAIAAIVAHEFGHVVQDLLDQPVLDDSQTFDEQSRRVEQQADCLAGVWARHMTRLGQINPVTFRAAFEQELAIISQLPVPRGEGLDDYDEVATHGTVAQRMIAFDSGMAGGSGAACGLVGVGGD